MITTVSLDYRLVVHSSYIPHLHSFFFVSDLVSPYLFTGFVLVVFPIEQASTFSDGADEFEDDTLIASEALSRRTGGFERNAGPGNWGMFGSLKFVLLKSKLNLLIPCGFVAIVVKDMTGNNVCVLNCIKVFHQFVLVSALCCIFLFSCPDITLLLLCLC